METMSLSGSWRLRQVGGDGQEFPAQVPGGVHTDLLAAGQIPDPFVGDKEFDVQWVAEKDWSFSRQFTVSAEMLAEDRVVLVCDGLDTLGQVTLNGKVLGRFENMFRVYQWEVKDILRPGENEIVFTFDSPVNYVTEWQRKNPLLGVTQAIPGASHIRKAPCHFGWDWGPMLPPIGIWKDLRLEGYSVAQFENVHLRQQVEGAKGFLSAQVEAEQWIEADLQVKLIVVGPDGKSWEQKAELDGKFGMVSVEIADLELWWPNGYGKQPLYQVEVVLQAGGRRLDGKKYKIGFRTIELSQKPDQWGESFTFIVNGVPIFAKGADWIPADSFPTRISDEYLQGLLRSAVDAHMNMLRIWGGGFYEEEDFYDLCDEYGILIWQDFVFACSIYPDREDFFANVREEAIQNVRRLRHRASLALWCGNNEMEQGWVDWGWNRPEDHETMRLKAAYDRMFHHLIPEVVAVEDPDRPYWPSSASSGIPFAEPNGEARGDCHYWDVWHGRKPFTAYRDTFPRFMSEFGFQSLPPMETIKTYAEEKDWNMTSYIMEHHQRSFKGNGLMIAQMTDTFRMPKDFPKLVYLSMLLQAEGIRYGVEHWRRHKERVSGILYWQLNDCWPVASWSSLDYYGRWKALHYMARRFYAPVLLSVEDSDTTMGVWVTSDVNAAWKGEIEWKLVHLDGRVVEAGNEQVSLEPLQSRQFINRTFDISAEERRSLVFLCTLKQNGSLISYSVSPFTSNRYLELVEPQITHQVEQKGEFAGIKLTSSSLARFVELALEGADVIFSDNYFDVPAGMEIGVCCQIPQGWTLEQFRERLRVVSLSDSF